MPLSTAPRRALDNSQALRISELITSQEQESSLSEINQNSQCEEEEVLEYTIYSNVEDKYEPAGPAVLTRS